LLMAKSKLPDKGDPRRTQKVALPPKAPTKADRVEIAPRPQTGDPAGMITQAMERKIGRK